MSSHTVRAVYWPEASATLGSSPYNAYGNIASCTPSAALRLYIETLAANAPNGSGHSPASPIVRSPNTSFAVRALGRYKLPR